MPSVSTMSGLSGSGFDPSEVNMRSDKLVMNYELNKLIAFGTGALAIVAIVAAVAFAILMPPMGILFLAGVGTASVAALSLGTTSIVHAVKVAKGKSIMEKISSSLRHEKVRA